MKSTLEQLVGDAVRELFGVTDAVFSVEPTELLHGDFSTNAALVVAKPLGKSPKEIAEVLAAKLEEIKPDSIASVTIAGPGFINFSFSAGYLRQMTDTILSQKERFGTTDHYAGQTWAIEYASPNPNKAMHLGHLRNVLTGVAVANLLEANRATVIREMVDNNRGIAIAKLMWGYLVGAHKDGKRTEDISYWAKHQDEWLTPAQAHKAPDQFIDEWYVFGAQECENKEIEDKVRSLVVRWEEQDPQVWMLWKKVLGYSYEGQALTMKRLGARFDRVWHEHEHYEEGKRYVEDGLEKGIFTKLDDGAVLTNLASYNLPDTILIKRDGTSLYITQDIALTALKKQSAHFNKMIWIIGPEQSLAMQQLFAICEQLGIGNRSEFEHLSYGYMSIKGQGKMSSRKGNVIYIDTLLDEAKDAVREIMKERIPTDDQETIAEQIAHAAVTFSILRAGRTRDTAFDFDSALEFEGDTGPYLQYSVVRASSVLAKGNELLGSDIQNSTDSSSEIEPLERIFVRFPDVVVRAAKDHEPSTVVTYLKDLASAFNSFYGNKQIIDAENPALSQHRLTITRAFIQVMTNGLTLLGISVPERM